MDRGAEEGGRRPGKTRQRAPDEQLKTWAYCVAAGIPDDLFWQLTPIELQALLDAIAERETERERRAALRAGLIAAVIENHSPYRKGPPKQPSDYLRERKRVQPFTEEEIARLAAREGPTPSIRGR